MPNVKDARLIEVLNYEAVNGLENTHLKFDISDTSIVRYRAEAKKRGLDIKQASQEVKEITGEAFDIDDFVKRYNIDLEKWEILYYEFIEGDWDVSAKKRDQDLKFTVENDKDGNKRQFMEGHAKRGGWEKKKNEKRSLRVKIAPRKYKFDEDRFRRELKETLKIDAPYVAKNIVTGGEHCLELNIVDLHLMALCWAPESGEDYDLKIARQRFFDAIETLIRMASPFSIDQIVFPYGSDFFNSDQDYPFSTTTNGTPMQNDSRWQKGFKVGREMVIMAINRLKKIAPVMAVGIAGNHDFQKTFYLGDVLEVKYENDDNVAVFNGPKTRKYYKYGKNLVGITHGKDVPMARLPLLMPQECPQWWAETKYREWHMGHLHHGAKAVTETGDDYQGIVIRHLKTLKATCEYEYGKGWVGAIGGAEAFLYHKEGGMITNFSHNL